MRCGFCNLFTQSRPADDLVAAYLDVLARQMQVVRRAVPHAVPMNFALGGGTPTFLTARQLRRLLHDLSTTFAAPLDQLPTSVETSPATASADRLKVLAEFGIERISIGVQSFDDSDAGSLGRPQRLGQVHRALDEIRRLRFRTLNIDLIYGRAASELQAATASADVKSWLASVRAALEYEPEELYLYPLYVRPETGLARAGGGAADHRVDLYRAARELLLDSGYEQASLRCFRRSGLSSATASDYRCQSDAMIGLGCGARSYTPKLHYGTEFAASQAGVRALLQQWIQLDDARLAEATHGFVLSPDEQCRRYTILSVLQAEGLDLAEFERRFGASPFARFEVLAALCDRGRLVVESGRLKLTPLGFEQSDVIGPLLFSPEVCDRLREFVAL
jgi:oxygen-independent coproporphyrinogen-3 oxidase